MARRRRKNKNENSGADLGRAIRGGISLRTPGRPDAAQQNMLTAVIRQIVTEQIMAVTQQFIAHLNELSENAHVAISMIEVIRRLLKEKGVITEEEFTEKVGSMQKNTKRASEIANDFDTSEEDRVRMMVDECEIDEGTAKSLVEHAKNIRDGLANVGAQEGENNEQGQTPPEPE